MKFKTRHRRPIYIQAAVPDFSRVQGLNLMILRREPGAFLIF